MRPKSHFVNLALSFLRVSCVIVIAVLCASLTVSAQVVPLAQHVVLVIDENTSFSTVYPSGMPWLVSEGKKYGYANNYYSDVSGSLLDYLYLASGSGESKYECGRCTGVQPSLGQPQLQLQRQRLFHVEQLRSDLHQRSDHRRKHFPADG